MYFQYEFDLRCNISGELFALDIDFPFLYYTFNGSHYFSDDWVVFPWFIMTGGVTILRESIFTTTPVISVYLFNLFICIKEYNINSLRHFNDLIACFLVLPGFAKYMHTWWWSDIKKLCEIVIGKIFNQIICLKHHTCL